MPEWGTGRGARPNRRLHLRHLLLAIAGAAGLFAALAALTQSSNANVKVSAFAQSVIFVFMVCGCVAYVFHARQKVERKAGPVIEPFTPVMSKLIHTVGFASLAAFLAISSGIEWYKSKPGEVVNYLPSPVYLFMVVNYAILRLWWKIDPLSFEAAENGLIFGVSNYVSWADINRYTWSGRQNRQLNLFLKQRSVVSLTMDSAFVPRLDAILGARVGKQEAALVK
jgi:hypothetical protein